MSIFKGSAVALVTPFTETGVNLKELRRLIDFQIENGTAALVICGTTGEPSTMSKEEKRLVIKTAVEHTAGRVPVIAGTGGNNTAAVAEDSVAAKELGADALLLVTPYYNKCSQEGLVRHFFKVADAAKLPMIIYNVPGRTGLNVLPKTYVRLMENPYIVGIKEASGNMAQVVEIARLTHGRLDLYSGEDALTVPMMAVGGKGVISVLANVAPKETAEMCAAFFAGNTDKAGELQRRYNPLIDALFSDVNPIPAKTALNMMGYQAGPLRLPLCEMSPALEENLKTRLTEAGLLGDTNAK